MESLHLEVRANAEIPQASSDARHSIDLDLGAFDNQKMFGTQALRANAASRRKHWCQTCNQMLLNLTIQLGHVPCRPGLTCAGSCRGEATASPDGVEPGTAMQLNQAPKSQRHCDAS